MNAFEGLSENWPFLQSGADILNSLTDAADVFIFAYSPKLRSLVSWTDNADRVLGVKDISITREANVFLRYMHPDDRFLLLEEFEQAIRGDGFYRATYRWIRPDTNKTHWLHCRGKLFRKDTEELFQGAILDLTEELSRSSSGATRADSLSAVLEAFPQLVLTLDSDLRILRVNRNPESFLSEPEGFWFGDEDFSYEDLAPGRTLLDGFSDQHQRQQFERDLQAVMSGEVPSVTKRFFSEGRSAAKLEVIPILVKGTTQGLLILLSDISEVARLEGKVSQLERMEGLRNLAIGLANNFNNALQSIIGQAATIRDSVENVDLVQHASEVIVEVARKASALTDQLLRLGSQSGESPSRVDLNIAVMSAVNRIEDIFSSGFKITASLGTPPPIYGDSEKIEEAIERALRGLPELAAESGSVSIHTQVVAVGEDEVPDLASGSYAQLTLHILEASASRDQGQKEGAPLDRSTARSLDLESSNELSVMLRIMHSLSGGVRVRNSAKDGVLIELYFPAVPDAAGEDISRAIQEDKSKPAIEDTSPEILIIDDDVIVLETVAAILRDGDYNCATASNYREALSQAKKHRGSLRLILLDALMPDMDGARLLTKLKRIRNDFRVIGFSGAPPEVTKKLLEAGAVRILRKPLDPLRLREVVREFMKTRHAA